MPLLTLDAALALPLCGLVSLLALLAAVAAARRRNARRAVRMLGLALVPVGLLLSGLVTLGVRLAGAAAAWATGLVLSPVVWTGLVVLVVGMVLLAVAGRLPGRRVEGPRRLARRDPVTASANGAAANGTPRAVRSGGGRRTARSGADDPLAEFDDVEEILRRRGIS